VKNLHAACRFRTLPIVNTMEDPMAAYATIETEGGNPPRVLRCSACGTGHGEAAWRLLPLVGRIEAAEVRALVSPWPDGVRIEIRRCRCGRTIAAKRALAGP
jgi:hypothetical protein